MDEKEKPAMGCVDMFFDTVSTDWVVSLILRSSKAKQHHPATVRLTHFHYKRINPNPFVLSILPSLRKGQHDQVVQSHLLQWSIYQRHFAKVPHSSSYCLINKEISLQNWRFGRIKHKSIWVTVKRYCHSGLHTSHAPWSSRRRQFVSRANGFGGRDFWGW